MIFSFIYIIFLCISFYRKYSIFYSRNTLIYFQISLFIIFFLMIIFNIIPTGVCYCSSDSEEKSGEFLSDFETFILTNQIAEMHNKLDDEAVDMNNILVSKYECLSRDMHNAKFKNDNTFQNFCKERISITDQLYSLFVDDSSKFKIKINQLISFLERNEMFLMTLNEELSNIDIQNELNKIENQKKNLISNKNFYKSLFDINK